MRLFKHYIPINTIFLVVSESFIIFASLIISKMLYKDSRLYGGVNFYRIIVIPIISIIIFYIGNMYHDLEICRIKETISKIFVCYVLLLLIISTIDFIFELNLIFSKEYLIFSLLSIISIILIRLIYSILMKINKLKNKIIIIGYSNVVRKLCSEIKKEGYMYDIIGIYCDELVNKNNDIKILGKISDIKNMLNFYNPNILVIALSERRGRFPFQFFINAKLKGINVEEITSFYEKITGKILIENLRPSWIIFSDGFRKNNFTSIIKRLSDIFMAIFGLLLFSPLMIIISIFIKIDSFGPIFFRQERVGENGRNFILVKFRTMVADAEKETGPVWSQTIDPRVTKLGKILRRTGMDEIPQLFNVLMGDMSFVGPRPERQHFVTELQQKIPFYTQRLAVRPGITGWAQVRYGYGATLEDAIEKLQYDLYYIKNMSIFLDLLIIFSTVHKVIFAKVAVEYKITHDSKDKNFIEEEYKIDEKRLSFTVSCAVGRETRETSIFGSRD